jgi:hypothetical protein
VPADRMAFTDNTVIDLSSVINAKGADVDHPAELSQPCCF